MDKNNGILTDGIDERIESFLRGTMSAEEETIFKLDVRQNPELRNRVMAMISLIRGFQTKNWAIEQEICQEIERVRPAKACVSHPRWQKAANNNENAAKSKSRVRPLLWWACSVAAVFVFFFSIYKNHRYHMLDAVVSPYYIEYDMSDISRGEVDSVSIAHLYMLFSQIQESRNVSNIVKELEPIYHSLDDDFTYYPWANDIAWNLALAYVKDDQIDKALSILEKLKQDNPDTPLYNKADELMKKLQEL